MSAKLQRSLFILAVVIAGLFANPAVSAAQQPKLDVKLFVGASATTYVSLLETGRERDTFAGWQVGFGPRYRKRRWFLEVLFSFNRWSLPRLSFDIDVGDPVLCPPDGICTLDFRGRVNSFELPISGGFIPYKNAFFKLFLYAGYVNHFNTRVIVNTRVEETGAEETVRLRPKEAELAVYQALARFGVSFDLAMFNFDFNYSISMNSATHTSYRTSYHQLQLNVAYLF